MKNLGAVQCRDEVARRLAELTPGDQPRWGRMDVSQMLRHVSGAFAMVLGEEPVQPVASVLHGRAGKFLVLYSGLRWARNFQTVAELDVVRRGLRAGDFRAEMDGLLMRLRGFCDAGNSELAEVHPMMGRMSRADWMRWGYLHTDHHLRQFGR